MPSSPQTVTTRGVFDYVYNSAGKAVVGATINCTLNYNSASVTSPIVNISEIQQTTTTDSNGFWRLNLIPNDTLTPSGTTYSISMPNSSYDISVASGGADVQSSTILVNAPSTLSPATVGLTGPITVTGNETVTGNLAVSGTTSLAGTTTGALTTGAASIGGDLTILSAFRLLFGAAVSKLVSGATSFSIRDNADANDNLSVTNAGAVTIRNGLTVTAGGATITAGDTVIAAGRLLLNAAAAKIKGGATSFSLRNNADSADNVLVTDAGAVTIRNSLSVPPSAGGTLATASYGTVPVKIARVLVGTDVSAPAASVSFTSIPSGFSHLEVVYQARCDAASTTNDMGWRANNDATSNYGAERGNASGTSVTAIETTSSNVSNLIPITGATSAANTSGFGRVLFPNYAATVFNKVSVANFGGWEVAGGLGTTAQLYASETVGIWFSTAAINRIDFFAISANFISGSAFTLYGIP